tara:strand:- start:153 stop:353 length:201 start_codon:yes stop_codon:yes gene_type:complete
MPPINFSEENRRLKKLAEEAKASAPPTPTPPTPPPPAPAPTPEPTPEAPKKTVKRVVKKKAAEPKA